MSNATTIAIVVITTAIFQLLFAFARAFQVIATLLGYLPRLLMPSYACECHLSTGSKIPQAILLAIFFTLHGGMHFNLCPLDGSKNI